jgi:type I restriction enzyme S subunit
MRDEWQARMLGEVAQVSAGNSAPQNKALFANGTHPFFRTADAGRLRFGDIYEANDYLNDDGAKGLRRYPKGTILFPKSGASTFLNHRVMLGVEGYVSSHLAAIVADRAQTEPRYLLYFLSTISAQDLVQDHAYPSLNLPAISGITIQVPPLPEQQRIVALLDEAFAGLATVKANAEQNLQNARAIFESHLQSVFSQRGEGWERVSLETLLDRRWIEGHLDGNHGSDYPRKEEFVQEGVPYISANCLDEQSNIDMSRAKYLIPARASLLRKGIARNNDVLFAHNATVGPVSILHTSEEKVILSTSLTYYRCNPNHILAEYLAHYMRSHEFKKQYLQVMRQSTRNQVPITKQREFFHIIPPLEDQERIVGTLDGLLENSQRLTRLYERKLAALEELKKSLLHQAFNGDL